eukprot:TRINITY_DN6593_c1_g1_i1.p1 TRINITY_DN6593_c1_g1~~TRINITY_DN6593_c1_g1_i1.p1  ORF type:complete len:137 (-),score=13.53 TRINITY_DN6593_c1_g1_i1:150-560(-)
MRAREGYLTKLGYKGGKWQRRWFVLTGRWITYHKTKKAKPKGKICLYIDGRASQCERVGHGRPISDDACKKGVKNRHGAPDNCFTVRVEDAKAWRQGSRSFYLEAESAQERDLWLDCILSNIEALAKQDTPQDAAA